MNFSQHSYILKPAITLQLSHVSLSILWNILSVTLVYLGEKALGPTSSLLVAGTLIILAACLWIAPKKSAIIYALLTVFQLLASFLTVRNAFLKDPSLWHNDISRYVGVTINLIGVFGTLLGLYLLFTIVIKSIETSIKTQ